MTEEKVLTGYPSIDKPWLRYYSEEAINRELPKCSIYEYMRERNINNLTDIALEYFGRKIIYKELFDNIEKTAKAFTALGVKRGDIVVVITITTPETIYMLYALNLLGAIPNMVDPRTSTDGIREYIKEVNAKYVVVIEPAYPKMEKTVEGTNVDKIVVVSPADSLTGIKKWVYQVTNRSGKLSNISMRWNKFIQDGLKATIEFDRYSENRCCVIVHTGGTTGLPKGVMLSDDNFNAAAQQAFDSPILMSKQDKFLNIMPPFIAYGMVLGIHTAISSGWHSIIIPKFTVEEFDKLLIKYRPAGIMGIPTYFEKLMESSLLSKADLSFLKVVLVGGDRTSAEFENKVNTFFGAHGCTMHLSKGYSMTEASSTATISFENANKVGSNGIPLCKTVVSTFDMETAAELTYGEEGELCIQTPTMMLGYYGKQAETEFILKEHADGTVWIHTGDVGTVDEDGFINVSGRAKRIIIRYDAWKVFPTHIENVVLQHDFVENCCVVGMEDKQHMQGKLPVVFVVCNQKYEGDNEYLASEIMALCGDQLPEYAQPVDIRFVESLPLTSIGKIDYRALESLLEETSTN